MMQKYPENLDINKIKDFKVSTPKEKEYNHHRIFTFKYNNVKLTFKTGAFYGKNKIDTVYSLNKEYEKNIKKLQIEAKIEKISPKEVTAFLQDYIDKYVKYVFGDITIADLGQGPQYYYDNSHKHFNGD